jgi:hypothetical protein
MEQTRNTHTKETKMRYAGYHYSVKDGKEMAVAAVGAHADVAKHMTVEQRARYGAYKVLKTFPWTKQGKIDCMAFCDQYNVANFSEFASAVRQ